MKIRLSRFLAICSSTLLCSCQTPPPLNDVRHVQSSEEAANVFVSAYPAVPWSDMVTKLEPKHNLSTADARAMAAVSTQSQVSQFLSTFAAGLGVGLPSRASSSLSTTTDGKTTLTSTKQLAPGAVPKDSGLPPEPPLDLAPDLSKAGITSGIDASTQLIAGTAVFQLAAILDNQLSKSLKLKGYNANLITFQINLQPLARNLPYDTYINLTLMPGSWKKAMSTSEYIDKSASSLSPIIVYPLVIADAMETSNVSKSVEIMRQAALSLSGIVSNIGVSGGVSGGSDNLNELIGADRNSLTTVGRISDHSLRIRLGAQLQGSRHLAMVPRTQNISVVVFSKAGEEEENFLDRLAVITHVFFADAETGIFLPEKQDSDVALDLQSDVLTVLEHHDFRFVPNRPECGNSKTAPISILRAVDRGDYTFFSHCLEWSSEQDDPNNGFSIKNRAKSMLSKINDEGVKIPSTQSTEKRYTSLYDLSTKTAQRKNTKKESPTTNNVTSADSLALDGEDMAPAFEIELRRVIAELMILQTKSRYAKLMIPLQLYERHHDLPDIDQLVFVKDEKSGAKVVVKGGRNLHAEKISAKLTVNVDGTISNLLADSVAVDSTGQIITVIFPGLKSNEVLSPPTQNKQKFQQKSTQKKDKDKAKKNINTTFDARSNKDETQKINLALELRYKKFVNNNEFFDVKTYKLNILSIAPKEPASPVSMSSSLIVPDSSGLAKISVTVDAWEGEPLSLRVTGAEIRNISPKGTLDVSLNSYSISPKSAVSLTLGNLAPTQVVQIQLFAGTAAIGAPISLSVEPWRYPER